MKELDLFLDQIEAIIDETYRLNEQPKFSYFGIVKKWIFRDCINTMKTIIRLNLEFKNTGEEQSLKSKSEILKITIATAPNGEICKEILIKYIFGKASKLETKICKEAMKGIKVIASDLMYNASNVAPLLIQESLFSMPEIDRNAYAELTSHELDGRLTAIYENINHLESNGWNSSYLTRDISSYLTHVFSAFALFNIDITPIIKYNSDFEKRFETYDAFRDIKFNQGIQKGNDKPNSTAPPTESKQIKKDNDVSAKIIPPQGFLSYFYENEDIANKFLIYTKGKTGIQVATEIKALVEMGKIDFSNQSAFLRLIGITSSKDGVIRYFRDSYERKLYPTDGCVISAMKHYQ